MAIQTRKGPEKDFDPNKLLPGEFAGTTDTKRIFYAFAAGETKEMATYEDMQQEIKNATGDIVAELTDGVETAIANTNAATELANQATMDVNTAKEAAETATQEANQATSDADAAAKAALEAAEKADKAVIDDSISSTSKTYSSSKINSLIAGVTGFSVLVVDTLPESDIDTHTIYFVPKETSSEGDIYDEYLYVQNAWEHIGSTDVDLSQYYTITESNSRDLADNTVAFTSNDSGPDGEHAILSVDKLTTGEKISSIMNKISRIFTNTRYILDLLGTEDITSESVKIGDGTVTGALRALNDSLKPKTITDLFTFDTTYLIDFKAEQYGKLIHINGLINNATSNVTITASDSVRSRISYATKALNYSGWSNSVQRQVNVVFSGNNITIDCGGAYQYTAFDIWYLTN